MKNNLLVATAIALLATSAVAGNHTHPNMGANATIQKGDSASVKAYGYNKQGDHYTTNNVRDHDTRDMSRDDRHVYPGQRVTYGTRSNQLIQKGGSAISDSTVNAQADIRPYGTYWK